MADQREQIAKNPKTSPDILEKLSEAVKSVRISLGLNPNLPENLVKKLAFDIDDDVKASIAKNPIVAENILKELFKNKSREINESLAQNTSTPVYILEKLFYNPNFKKNLANNSSLPNELLKDLIKNNEYKKIAQKTLKKKQDEASIKASSEKYTNKGSNSESFKKLEEAVSTKKIKIFKDTIKKVSIETKISLDYYKKLTILATEINATAILKHIFKLIDPGKELLSDCFFIAIRNNKIKVVEYLLDLGGDINAVNEKNENALLISILNNKPKTIDFLLDANINIDFSDANGNTALHHAIKMKKSKIVEVLINKDADLNIENNKGLVALALAWNLNVASSLMDLLLDKGRTNMIGKAGQKIMNEAITFAGDGKKEQRLRMKNLLFTNHVSNMTEEEFIKKHGRTEEISSNISKLLTPNPNNNETIMKGTFTNSGYFPRDVDYKNIKHNWDALDYAIDLSNKIAKILNDADCYAPNTEGESSYEPFFIPYTGWKDLVNFDSKPSQEALNESRGAYNKRPSFFTNYVNEFIDDIEEGKEFIDKNQYIAFKKASKLMGDNLTEIYNIQLYPDFIEFPWFFVGLDKYRNLIGVVTSAVWT